MLAYHQNWVKNPTEETAMQSGILWNMWRNQMPPYKELKNGQSVLMVGAGGPTRGIVMYEGKVRYLVKAYYESHEEAWAILAKAIPLKIRTGQLTRKIFLESGYTQKASPQGWLMAWYDDPFRWIGDARPSTLKFRQNGWSEIPESGVPNISKSGKSENEQDDRHEKEILQRTNAKPREIQNLVKSRRGQGIFKSNVYLYEHRCRVTGTSMKQHLIASHIKPWRESSDKEKIDGYNGLLLAPHVDHLFDKGFISFADDGKLLISAKLNKNVLKTWGIPNTMNVGAFQSKQRQYLKYHREKKFQK
jgi:hypothetical protein